MFRLVFLLSWLTVVTAGSHSLVALATYIVGKTPFPEFSVVLMLDDLPIIYYDSHTWKVVYRSHGDSEYYNEDQRDAVVALNDMYNSMKERSFYLKAQLNHTEGVHVHQRLAGCELLNGDKPGLFRTWDGFSGQNVEEFTFDTNKKYIEMKKPWMIAWNQMEKVHVKFLFENVYQPACIKILRRYLNKEKNNVKKKVKPRVRLLKKKLRDSEGLQISCLATGFYPRHMNLTLFRDDQPVDDDQMTGGEILPNGDGTYQMRKSLRISEEKQREGHHYNCTMKLLNLDNKLDIMFDAVESLPGSSSVSVVISVLVIVCVSVLIVIALIRWRKRRLDAASL